MSGMTLTKTGDTTDTDDKTDTNAVVLAAGDVVIYLSDSDLSSATEGGNGLFAYDGGILYLYGIEFSSTENSSRGVYTVDGGYAIIYDINIKTTGAHCAALANDTGGGYIHAANATLSTAGQGSPLIYSTGTIEVVNASGEGTQIVGMEGLNYVKISNSDLSSTLSTATNDPVANAVILYQSTSGDSSEGTADMQVCNSTLKAPNLSTGSFFYITNTDATITLEKTTVTFDTDKCYLIYSAGNSSSAGWGSSGSNGGNTEVTFIEETIEGGLYCDNISTLTLYVTDNSTWTGYTTYDSDAYTSSASGTGITIALDSTSEWIVNGNSTVLNLYAASGSKIVDEAGNTVTIKSSTKTVSGTSDYTIHRNGNVFRYR